jgi:hypothetical protein
MPIVYKCPSFEPKVASLEFTTSYVAVVGDHTAWPRTAQRQSKEIADGLAATMAVLESEQHRLHWMSTNDPTLDSMGTLIGLGDKFLANGVHGGRSNYSLLDSRIGFLDSESEFSEFAALVTIDGSDNSKQAESGRHSAPATFQESGR